MPNVLPGTFDPLLVFPERPDGYVIWAIFMLLALGALIAAWRTFSGLSRSQWVGFLFLLVISVPLNSILVLPLTAVMPLSSLPRVAQVAPVSLLGLLCALLAGAWMGIGPAIVVGFASGATRWLLAGGRVTQPAEIALFAAIAAICMQQNYRGWLGDVLRRPLFASAVASVAALLLSFPAIYAAAPGDELSALDYASTLFVFTAVPVLAEGFLNGLLTQVACLAFPTMRRQRPAKATPFYARSLNRRLLITILPITFVTISFQVIFVGATALDEARSQTIEQLSRSAQAAVELVDPFFVEGQAVLAQFAADDRLQDVSPIVRQARLSSAIRTVAFFDEMMLVDRGGKILNSIQVGATDSPGSTGSSVSPPELTSDEKDLLAHIQTTGAPLRTGVQREANGSGMVSFMQPIGAGSSPQSILIGRTRLAINPLLNTIRRNLAGKGDFGVGYLIDDSSSRIIVHPDAGLEMTQWIFDRSQK